MRSFIAAHEDIMIATNHDRLTDVAKGYKDISSDRPDAAQVLKVVSGIEATTTIGWGPFPSTAIGHYTSFPLKFNGGVRKKGAPEDEFRPAQQLVAQLHALGGLDLGTGFDGIVTLAHPRSLPGSLGGLSFGFGYFEDLRVSAFGANPAFHFSDFDSTTLQIMLAGGSGNPAVDAIVGHSFDFDCWSC